MPSLFLSHAGVDSDAAVALAKRIEASPDAVAAGLQVWIDKADLKTGRRWKGGLQDGLRQSTAFAVYVGSRGIVNWVQDEVDVALDKAHNPNDPGYPLIPVLAAGVDPKILPSFLSQYQGVTDVERDGEAFNRLLRAVLRLEPRAPVQAVDDPFVGLRAFDSSKAHLFFGRETDVDTLVKLLRDETLVMVTGDSGSGKSSLVKAGLIPAFRGGRLGKPRDQGLDETIWQVVGTRPGNEPFGRLADDLRDTARLAGISVPAASELAAMVRPNAGKSPNPDAVRDALLSSLPADIAGRAKFLVVVDQFEEFRTATAAADYVAALLRLADPGDDRVRVVLTMRRDYYFACASFPPLYQRLEANDRRSRMVLHRMAKERLREAVSEPLRLTGTPEAQRRALADAVVRDAGDEAGELAVLQFALWRTWQTRRDHGGDLLATYNALGRVEGALANEAEHVFLGLSPDEQARAETLFVRLVRPGEAAGVTRRIARLDEFEPATQALAQKLSLEEQSRLLTLGEGTVEIAHEQLATQWVRYHGWIGNVGGDRRGDDLRVLQRLIDDAAKVRGDDDLARGGDLADYERLASVRPAWLSSAEQGFVDRSTADRKRENRERKERIRTAEALAKQAQELASTRWWQLWGSVAATMALLVFAVFAWSQRWAAQQNLATANRALVSAIWNDLPETTSDVLPIRARNAVWQLAANRSSLATPFLEHLNSSFDRSMRLSANFSLITRAINGPSVLTPEQAQAALAPLLDAMTRTTDGHQLEALAAAVLALTPSPEEAQTALSLVLDVMTRTTDVDQLGDLAKAVQALARQVGPEQALAALAPLLDAMTRTTDVDRLVASATVVQALAPQLGPEQAQAALATVLDSMTRTTNRYQLGALAVAVWPLALQLGPEQVEAALAKVLDAMTRTTDVDPLKALAAAVQALAPKLGSEQAQEALAPLLDAMSRTTDVSHLGALDAAVQALALQLESEQVQAALALVIDAMTRTTFEYQLEVLAAAVKALAQQLGPEQAQALGPVLDTRITDWDQLWALVVAVQAHAQQVGPEQAQAALAPILDAMTRTDGYELETLAAAAQPLARQLNSGQVQAALALVLDAMSRTTHGDQLEALAATVQALAPSRERAQAALAPLLDAITRADGYELEASAAAVQALARQLGSKQAQAAQAPLLDAMKRTTDVDQLRALAAAVQALARQVGPEQGEAALVPVLDGMTRATDVDQLEALAADHRSLARQLGSKQAQAALAPLLDAMTRTTDVVQLGALAADFQELARQMGPEQAQAALVPLLDAMTRTTYGHQLGALAAAVLALAPQLERPGTPSETEVLRTALAWAPDAASAAALAGVYVVLMSHSSERDFAGAIATALGFPTSVGPATDVLIEALREVGGPGKEAGLDATLAWLREAYPDIDPDAVPVCPPPPAGWEGLQCPPV